MLVGRKPDALHKSGLDAVKPLCGMTSSGKPWLAVGFDVAT
jgi:hypothetical protein